MEDQYCLNCANWQRNEDPCIGRCKKIAGWFFQFEGDDCKCYESGEERQPEEPGYISAPRRPGSRIGEVIEQNADRIRELRKEGRTYYNIALMIGIPGRSGESIRVWLKKHPEDGKNA